MASFYEDFVQANGALASPWSTAAGAAGPLVVVENRGSSDSTVDHGSQAAHGLTLSGNYQVSFWCNCEDTTGGGVSITLYSSTTFNGYGFFIGNATHIRRFDAGVQQANQTNIDRNDTGDFYVEFTHTSAGVMDIYLDGVAQGAITDSTHSNSGNTVAIVADSTTSPTRENKIWAFEIKDSIGVTGGVGRAFVRERILNPRGAVNRASRW